jgi:hypothetical protein
MWFFDVATGLLLRERTTTETALVPLQEQIDYDEYRRVDGVAFPTKGSPRRLPSSGDGVTTYTSA